MKTVCCFGHRKIENKDVLKQELFSVMEKLIVEDSAERFLFGSNSQFNDLCYDVVVSLKERYPQIKCIYVRAEYPYIEDGRDQTAAFFEIEFQHFSNFLELY